MTEPASTAASCNENTEEESSSLSNEIVIGIDIGTSPCHVSVWNGSAVAVWTKEILEMMKRFCKTSKDHDFSIGAGSSSSSTEVSLDIVQNFGMNQFFNIIFGESAKFPFLMHTVDTKDRPFVDPFMKKLWRTTISVELLGKFMIELRSMIETQMNRRIRTEVFTVPVSFSLLQLNQIRRACEKDDLKVIMTPQPTAVALWYVIHKLYANDTSHEDVDNEIKKIALIFNMDAGYCDVSVIEAEKGKFRVKSMTGSSIGGEDLLRNMMHYLLPDSEKIFKRNVHWNSDITSMAFLRSKIHDVITKLSTETSVKVNLDLVDIGMKIHREVTRKEFEDENKEVLEKCENLIIECLKDAKIEAENINDVIIVGGCCNIPSVENLVTKICKGKEIYKGMNNHLNAVLCGAVVAGAVVEDSDNSEFFTSQVTLHDIRILVDGKKFELVIPKNTSVPMPWQIVFSTVNDNNQTTGSIVVYEGGEEGQMADENNVLGNLRISEAPKGVHNFTISMTIDHRNWLTVTTSTSIGMPTSDGQSVIAKFDDQFLIRTKFDDTIDLATFFN